MFTGGASGATPPGGRRPDAEGVFADVFEEVSIIHLLSLHILNCSAQLLRPEVERHAPWWSWLGAACGGGIGFIVVGSRHVLVAALQRTNSVCHQANDPGLMVGAFAGNRLGAIRDAKGKSVAAVFSELGGNQKAEVSLSYRPRIHSQLKVMH